MAFVVVMGPQGSGKGTQAEMLSAKLGLPVIATGQIVRQVASEDTPLGREIRSLQEAGNLVPDRTLVDLIRERTHLDDCQAGCGCIFDGFPRTVPQGMLLEEMAQTKAEDVVALYIDVPRELLLKRLIGRRTCPVCGTIYNVYFKPSKREGFCDLDGSALSARTDDTPEAIHTRLALYDEKTAPLLDFYRQTGRLKQVDGTGSPEEVFARILEVLKAKLN